MIALLPSFIVMVMAEGNRMAEGLSNICALAALPGVFHAATFRRHSC